MTSHPSGIIEFLRRPEVVTDMLQIAKTVIAATLGWWLSVWVLDSQMPFLAPWAALLTVHATIHRTLARGAQTMVASVAGVALSFVVGHFLGVSLWTFGLALLAGVVLARVPWIRDEGIAIAKHKLGKHTCKLCFAHTCRTKKKETTNWATHIFKSRP